MSDPVIERSVREAVRRLQEASAQAEAAVSGAGAAIEGWFSDAIGAGSSWSAAKERARRARVDADLYASQADGLVARGDPNEVAQFLRRAGEAADLRDLLATVDLLKPSTAVATVAADTAKDLVGLTRWLVPAVLGVAGLVAVAVVAMKVVPK